MNFCMLKLKIIFIAALLACACAANKTAYGLEDVLTGADAAARGGAYLGGADNNSFVFQNYAAIAQNPAPRVSLTAFKLISEVNYLSAAYSQGSFGLGALTIREDGGKIRSSSNQISGGRISYSDTTLYGAYSLPVDFAGEQFALGLRGKYSSRHFTGFDGTAWGLGFDAAGQYQYGDYWTLGAELNNLLATGLRWTSGETEFLPLTLALGVKFKALGPEGYYWQKFERQSLDFYADWRTADYDTLFSAGVEFRAADYLALRGGIRQVYDLWGEAGTKHLKFSAGAGVNWRGFYLDYAYNPADDLAETLTHFFTLAYRFDLPNPKPEPEPELPVRRRIFSDIDHLALAEHLAIEDLGYLGIFEPISGSLFQPQAEMTRGELVAILVDLLDESEVNMPDNNGEVVYYNNYAEKASAYGLLRGYPDGSYRLEQPVRRDEAACFVIRYDEILFNNDKQLNVSIQKYRDVPDLHWGQVDINTTKQQSLTQGIGKDVFLPKTNLTRLDAARIISRMEAIREARQYLPELIIDTQ
ncbi:putative outer membrane protein [Candidatus Termititenax aidoneus]|uniref:Outer membrane protein n=1 Tax=Termititenax aidoneus TaxID=2218524 RepID=A0A388TA56_TERA1|nr:putative outer membrane protein [Candidatus Termititenax aidoneus]